MIRRLQKSFAEKDKGFTLVELLVVIVIIGILAAVAIPMFLAQRKKGVDAGVKADVKNIATAMETYNTEHRTYSTDKAAVEAEGDPVKLSDENTKIQVAVGADNANGRATQYCVKGWNEDGNANAEDKAFYFANDGSGVMKSADLKGWCLDVAFSEFEDWDFSAPAPAPQN